MIRNASLRAKLTLSFGALLLVMLTMSAISYVSLRTTARFSAAAETKAQEAYLARSIEALINARNADIGSFLLSGDEERMVKYQKHNRALAEEFSQLESLLTTDLGKRLFAQLRQTADEYNRGAQRVVALKRDHQTQAAADLLLGPEMSALPTAMENNVAEFVKLCQELDVSTRTEAEARATRWIIALGIISLVISIPVAAVVPHSVSAEVRKMLVVIEEIAAKNLAVDDIASSSDDELGKAGGALNRMKNNVSELIRSISGTAVLVANASEEISASATQHSQSTDAQKGQTSQVAVAMQEMSRTVHEVSENCNRAAEASRQAAETAREGGTIVEGSLARMRAIADSVSTTAQKVEELGKSSDQIGRIIGVIDDIADQTNLLALNAAIEAARAGEQGRGFAVVADEVRKLAERTTSATKEVAHMVESIQSETKTAVAAMHDGTNQVQEGVKTTARAGDSLKQIIHMSEQVGDMITHIATAATEQSAASEEINQNVTQMTRLITDSAVGAQQAARACQELSELALDLQQLVSNFKLKAGSDSTSPPSARDAGLSDRRWSAVTSKGLAAGA
jgi:methyl-accepting chemotaxis protein